MIDKRTCCWCGMPLKKDYVKIEQTYWCSEKCYGDDMEESDKSHMNEKEFWEG